MEVIRFFVRQANGEADNESSSVGQDHNRRIKNQDKTVRGAWCVVRAWCDGRHRRVEVVRMVNDGPGESVSAVGATGHARRNELWWSNAKEADSHRTNVAQVKS